MSKKEEKLSKKELNETLGGLATDVGNSVDCLKINKNKVSHCECLYVNLSATYNINKIDSCRCTCTGGPLF